MQKSSVNRCYMAWLPEAGWKYVVLESHTFSSISFCSLYQCITSHSCPSVRFWELSNLVSWLHSSRPTIDKQKSMLQHEKIELGVLSGYKRAKNKMIPTKSFTPLNILTFETMQRSFFFFAFVQSLQKHA